MNDLCKTCNGACCRTLAFPANTAMGQFIAATRGQLCGNLVFVESTCRHLTAEGTCRIYINRPDECIAYQAGCLECRLTREFCNL